MPSPKDPAKLAAKLRKQRLLFLQENLNKARLDISMHKLTTYADVFARLGVGPDSGLPKDTIALGTNAINVGDFNLHVAIPLTQLLARKLQSEMANGHEVTLELPVVSKPEQTPAPAKTIDEPVLDDKHVSSDIQLPSWWPSDVVFPGCTLMDFQLKAGRNMAHQLFVLNNRAAMLRASVGTGKTFMFFYLISCLHKAGWFKGKTFSPWPALIVTKASVVEQTRRVGEKMFGLDPVRHFRCLHYDALRSSAGSVMIEETIIVEDGIPRKRWKWRPGVHPLLFVLDESHSAKNEDSQQSQIVQQIAKLEDVNVKVICSSATHFTRVCEAKYFVINAGIEYNIV